MARKQCKTKSRQEIGRSLSELQGQDHTQLSHGWKKKSLFNLSFEVVCDTIPTYKESWESAECVPEVLWSCQKFQGTVLRESFQQYMEVPRRENQEVEDTTIQSPAQCVREEEGC